MNTRCSKNFYLGWSTNVFFSRIHQDTCTIITIKSASRLMQTFKIQIIILSSKSWISIARILKTPLRVKTMYFFSWSTCKNKWASYGRSFGLFPSSSSHGPRATPIIEDIEGEKELHRESATAPAQPTPPWPDHHRGLAREFPDAAICRHWEQIQFLHGEPHPDSSHYRTPMSMVWGMASIHR